MKKAFLLSVTTVLLLATAVAAPEAKDAVTGTSAVTKIESFLARTDIVLVKDVYTLGKISGLYSSSGDINAINAYEPGQKEKSLKGLIFRINEGQRDDRSLSSFLDMEEIEDLSSGIASIIRLTEKRERSDNSYTEITYTTRDSLSFGVYLGEGEEEIFITAGETEKLTIYLEPRRLKEIKKIVDYGYTLLKMK